MEPRWPDHMKDSKYNRFIGSLDRFDIWTMIFPDERHSWIVAIWGPTYSEYNRYRVQNIRMDFNGYWSQEGHPSKQELMLIEHYVSLFVPELGLMSSYTEDITNGT